MLRTLIEVAVFLAALLVFMVGTARAEQPSTAINFGVDPSTSGKTLGLSHVVPLRAPFVFELATGVYTERNLFNSDEPGVYGGIALGVQAVSESGLYARATVGPAALTEHHDRLSGPIQFRLGTGLGIANDDGHVGLFYQHFSNGGLASPNLGYNHIGVEAGIRW